MRSLLRADASLEGVSNSSGQLRHELRVSRSADLAVELGGRPRSCGEIVAEDLPADTSCPDPSGDSPRPVSSADSGGFDAYASRRVAPSEDDRDGATVRAPGGAGDVRDALGGRGTRSPTAISSGSASRPSGRPAPTFGEHLVAAAALLVGEASSPSHGVGRGRPGRDCVAADSVARVEVGDEPREREHGRLRHRVVRHPGRRPLARGRGDVDDHAPRAPADAGARRGSRAHSS